MTFRPGKSGHPGGRSKGVVEFCKLEQSLTIRAIEELKHIAFNSPDNRARLAAIKEINDRAFGRPVQPLDGDGAGGPINVIIRILSDVDEDD